MLLLAFTSIVRAQTIPPYTTPVNWGGLPGYFFLTPIKIGFNPNQVPPSMMIMDGNGEVAYIRNLPMGQFAGDFKIQNNGLMTYSTHNKFYLMDNTFTIVDSVSCGNGVDTDFHDMKILPNGHFLMLGIEDVVKDLHAYNVFGPNDVPGDYNAIVESAIVQELDVNKNVVFQWHAIDYFAFLDIDDVWLTDPYVVDWTHSNAVEYDQDGNLLLCSRHFNEITKINRQDSSVMWRLGGNANQFNFLNDPGQFKRQHDVRRMPNGNLSLFDNGDGTFSNPFHAAAGKDYVLDETAMTADLVWSYTDNPNEYSIAMGSYQHEPGGTAVVGYGWSDTQNKVFSVANNSGQKIFELAFNDSLVSYRVQYYPSLPWTWGRPEITCYENGGQYFLDAGPGHPSYNWSNGATTQVIPLTATGTYSVFVPVGINGYFRSPDFQVYNMADPCGLSGISEATVAVLQPYPNPVHDVLHLKVIRGLNEALDVKLFDLTGKQMLSVYPDRDGSCILNVSTIPAGVYWARYGSAAVKVVKY